MRLAFSDKLIVTNHFDPEMAMLADRRILVDSPSELGSCFTAGGRLSYADCRRRCTVRMAVSRPGLLHRWPDGLKLRDLLERVRGPFN